MDGILTGVGGFPRRLQNRVDCLAIAAVVMGIIVLRQTRMKLWSMVVVVTVLLIGQWWFVEYLLIVTFGKWRGFAR